MNGNPNILVVDDEPDSAANVRYLLEKSGFVVSVVFSAEEAFRFLITNLPDIILLDVVLPDIPGTEFCKAIKQDKRYVAIPVILISGLRTSDEELRLGFSCGAADYISRPFKNNELVARLRNTLSTTRENEDQFSSDREMAKFQTMSHRETGETSVLFNAAPLRTQYPESFQNILKEYDKILEDAIDERFFMVQHNLREKLNHLSGNLCFLKAGAKDIIDIHRQCIITRISEAKPKEQKVVLEESRLLLIELMGNMINYYRRTSI